MPLVRLRLYETGVGYFERHGPLQSGTRLPVPATHLDDALNSLVIWDPEGKTQINRLSFASIITEDKRRALAGLPAHDEGELGFDDILEGLRGARVIVEARGKAFRGRLLAQLRGKNSGLRVCSLADQERKTETVSPVDQDCVHEDETVLTLISEKSEVLRFPTREITSLRPLEPKEAGRLSMAAESSAGAQRAIQLEGKATGPVSLGYVAETPLWRTSYRVLLPESRQGRGLLQAWALIHNDTEEPWRQVSVDLVSGQPDSFLFPFAAPRYQHRRLVTPEQELASVRQLERKGADDRWDRGEEYSGHGAGVGGGLGLSSFGMVGYGAGGGGLGLSGESSLLSIGDIASLDPAEGKAVGALFRYTLARPVDLEPHHSALLPLLSENVQMRRVTLFEGSDSKQSSKGVQGKSVLVLTNQTQQTLPAGIMSIFQGGSFAGETALPRLNAGQVGHVSFGLDLDIQLTETQRAEKDTSRLFRSEQREEHFLIQRHYVRSTDVDFLIINRSHEDREVRISFKAANNSRLTGADEISALAADGRLIAIFHVKAGTQRKVKLNKEQGLVERKVDPSYDDLSDWADTPGLDNKQKAHLRQLVEATGAVVAAKNRRASLSASIEREIANLDSMRASLTALRGVDEKKGQALAGELLKAEERLAKLRKARAGVPLLAKQRTLKAAWLKLNE